MHINRSRFTLKVITPDLIEQFIPGKNPVNIAHEQIKYFKLLESEFDRFTFSQHTAFQAIDGETTDGDLIKVLFHIMGSPAQNRVNTGNKLHYAKGFGDVIICTAVQANHLLEFGPFGRQHYHWDFSSPLLAAQAP